MSDSTKTLELIRAASLEVDLENSQKSLDGLLDAVAEVADERGLQSPNRQRSHDSLASLGSLSKSGGSIGLDIDSSEKSSVARKKDSLRSTSPRSKTPSKTDGTTPAAKQHKHIANSAPISLDEEGISEDVDALIGSMKENKIIDSKFKPKSDPNENFAISKTQRPKSASYSQRSRGSKSDRSSRYDHGLSEKPHRADSSRLSKLLTSYEEQDKAPIVQSMTQEMLFKSMRLIQPNGRVSKRPQPTSSSSIKNIIEILSKPKESGLFGKAKSQDLHPTDLYATYDDAKNCTFTPKIKKNLSMETDQDKDEGKASSFIVRQEMKETHKRKNIDYDLGKADYDAIVDKKYCTKCGGQQKFDEIKEKKKKCPLCNVEYKRKIEWAQVKSGFFDKNKIAVEKASTLRHNPEEDIRRTEIEIRHLKLKILEDYRKAVEGASLMKHKLQADRQLRHVNITKAKTERLKLDPEVEFNKAMDEANKVKHEQQEELKKMLDKLTILQDRFEDFMRAEEKFRPKTGLGFTEKKWDEQLKNQYFERMEENLVRRELKIEKLEHEVLSTQYPFKPHIASKKDDDDIDADYNPVQAFLERLEVELQALKEKSDAYWAERRGFKKEDFRVKVHNEPFRP